MVRQGFGHENDQVKVIKTNSTIAQNLVKVFQVRPTQKKPYLKDPHSPGTIGCVWTLNRESCWLIFIIPPWDCRFSIVDFNLTVRVQCTNKNKVSKHASFRIACRFLKLFFLIIFSVFFALINYFYSAFLLYWIFLDCFFCFIELLFIVLVCSC